MGHRAGAEPHSGATVYRLEPVSRVLPPPPAPAPAVSKTSWWATVEKWSQGPGEWAQRSKELPFWAPSWGGAPTRGQVLLDEVSACIVHSFIHPASIY